jgi:hypothetical protein
MEPPCIDLANGVNPQLSLWYHAVGADIGWFHVDLFSGSELFMDVAPPIAGNQGDTWRELVIDLTPWIGGVVGVRFRGVTTCKDKGDFAIDDFGVTEVITSTGEFQSGVSGKLSIFPNPAGGEVTVALHNAADQQYVIRIIDMVGRVVYHKSIGTTGNKIREVISLSDFSNGTYLLELKSEKESYQKKLSIIGPRF